MRIGRRRVAVPLALLGLLPVLGPQMRGQAAIRPHTAYVEGLPFNTGTNGCTGPLVAVYGSSSMETFIEQAAADYCNTFADKSTAPDVEYAHGGDSCPGDVFASSDDQDNVVGLSDVFANSCVVEGFLLGPNNITDLPIGVDVVEAIALCPNANVPQGGTITAYAPSTQTPCQGGSIDPAVNPLGFCAPQPVHRSS